MKSKKDNFNWNLLCHNEFIILDIETTGFSPAKGGRIIEIGAVKIKNNEIIEEFHSYVNPQLKIPSLITDLTGIDDNKVKTAPVIGNVLPKFKQFIGDTVIVAHNAPFDWNRFLKKGFESIGVVATNEVIDTKLLSRRIFPEYKKHSLTDTCSYLNINIEEHHRAMDDTYATTKAFVKLKEIAQNNNILPDQPIITCQNSLKPEVEEINIAIKKVSYWELKRNNKIIHQRHYVNLFYNGVFCIAFFDIKNKSWYLKESKKEIKFIDFELIENQVLKFLKINNRNDFIEYRNK